MDGNAHLRSDIGGAIRRRGLIHRRQRDNGKVLFIGDAQVALLTSREGAFANGQTIGGVKVQWCSGGET